MFPNEQPVESGMLVSHDDGGLIYRVQDVRLSTEGYERTHEIGRKVVNYVQLQSGSYPPGTKWSKPEEEFREHFTPVQ